MDNINMWVWMLCVNIVFACISMLPVLFFKPRSVSVFDMSVVVVPYVVWSAMFFANLIPKSLGNIVEVAIVGLSSGLFVSLRPIMGFGVEKRLLGGIVSLALACVAAVAIYYLTPGLRE